MHSHNANPFHYALLREKKILHRAVLDLTLKWWICFYVIVLSLLQEKQISLQSIWYNLFTESVQLFLLKTTVLAWDINYNKIMIWLFLFMFCTAHNKTNVRWSCTVNSKSQQCKLCRYMVNEVLLSDKCNSHWPL